MGKGPGRKGGSSKVVPTTTTRRDSKKKAQDRKQAVAAAQAAKEDTADDKNGRDDDKKAAVSEAVAEASSNDGSAEDSQKEGSGAEDTVDEDDDDSEKDEPPKKPLAFPDGLPDTVLAAKLARTKDRTTEPARDDHPAPTQAEGLPAKRATVPVIGKRLSDSQQGGGASPKGSKPRKSAEGTVTIKQSQWDTLMDKIDKMDKSVPQVTV